MFVQLVSKRRQTMPTIGTQFIIFFSFFYRCFLTGSGTYWGFGGIALSAYIWTSKLTSLAGNWSRHVPPLGRPHCMNGHGNKPRTEETAPDVPVRNQGISSFHGNVYDWKNIPESLFFNKSTDLGEDFRKTTLGTRKYVHKV